MSEIPQRTAPGPWTRQPGKPPVFDRDLRPVSFIVEAEFLFHVEQLHDPMIAMLKQARADLLLGRRSQKLVDQITELLVRAGVA